jgi:acyl-CoA thioesterase II
MTTYQEPKTGQEAVERFVRTLNVEDAGGDRYVSTPEPYYPEEQRLFGGLVLAQAVIAAGRTVDEASMHSLHAYFLRGGRPGVPITYGVERVRDGRTFHARRVLVRQGDEAICDVTVSFALTEEGIAHQEDMPEAPDPETLPDAREAHPRDDGEPWPLGPIEWRAVDAPAKAMPGEPLISREWARLRHPLPPDPVLHAAALVFVSDAGSFAAIERRYGWDEIILKASASLDHAFWLHHPFFWDSWLLMVTHSPVAYSSRALSYRNFYTRGGLHVASMAQEAVVRRGTPEAGG